MGARRVVFWVGVILSGAVFNLSARDAGAKGLRLMSWNIRHCRGMDGRIEYDRTAEAILRCEADVVALQEVDSVTTRSRGVDIARRLGELTAMHTMFAPAIDFDGGKYGVAVLTREKPLSWSHLPLPGGDEARVVLVVELEKCYILCTHLSLDGAEREASAEAIDRVGSSLDKPAFLLGDLNALPSSAEMTRLAASWKMLNDPQAHTFPSAGPGQTIDYIWGRSSDGRTYSTLGRRVPADSVASDHRPVVVDVRVSVARDAIMRTAPYLQNPSTDAVTVMWHTTVPCHSWVEYGIDSTRLVRTREFVEGIAVANTTHNRVRLADLTPGTRYYYRVCSREITLYNPYHKEFGETATSPISSFKTLDERSGDFTTVIFNDLHNNKPLFDRLREVVAGVPCDMVFFNGDCIPDVDSEETALGAIDHYCRGVGGDRIPCIFLRGNHETRGAYSPFLWNLLERVNGRSYGAFTVAGVRFVLLDCGEDKPDEHPVYYELNDFSAHRLEQAEFLKRETSSREFRRASKRVLLHHIPVWGCADEYVPCRELWGGILSKVPFTAALCGHVHSYRYLPAGDPEGNPFPVIIGGGPEENNIATVAVLTKRGRELGAKVLDVDGKCLLDLKL